MLRASDGSWGGQCIDDGNATTTPTITTSTTSTSRFAQYNRLYAAGAVAIARGAIPGLRRFCARCWQYVTAAVELAVRVALWRKSPSRSRAQTRLPFIAGGFSDSGSSSGSSTSRYIIAGVAAVVFIYIFQYKELRPHF